MKEDVPYPRVTFILTGYNQSDLIDLAIQGAMSQDYPNLEIILTDDCSDDDTYIKMEKARSNYSGRHAVKTNLLSKNLGTFGNIYDAFKKASGDIIVFAGGDDVSYPHRVSVIVEYWRSSGFDAFYSRYDVIDVTGNIIKHDWKPPSENLWLIDYFPGQKVDPLHGASMACHRSVLERLDVGDARIRSEDTYLTLMMGLDGREIEYIDQSLVQYRRHAGALTNEIAPEPTIKAVMDRERRQMRFAASQAALLRMFAKLAKGRLPETVTAGPLRDDIILFEHRARWEQSTLLERIGIFGAARRRGHLPWLVPRIIGFRLFARIKARSLSRRTA